MPFWVSGPDAVAVLGSTPPEPWMTEALRLPYPAVLMVFGTPLLIETNSWWLRELAALRAADGAVTEAVEAMAESMIEAMPGAEVGADHNLAEAFERGGAIHGMVLTADRDGFLDDVVVWLVSGPADDGEELSGALLGSRSQSVLRPVIDNAACAAAWGSWHAPKPNQRFTGGPNAARKLARTGSYKRRAASGEIAGVHTLDLASTTGRGRKAAESSGRTVSAHLRRGHWRRVRVGPRDDWHHEGRWIAPTLVAGGSEGPVDPALRTYRLPDPPDEPVKVDDADDWDLTGDTD